MPPEAILLLEGLCLKAAAVQLEPDVLHTLDSLYAFYHRQWWCYSHMYPVFKLLQALLNGVAVLVLAAGMIAGCICENSIVVTYLAAWGIVHKGWNHFKKFPIQVDRWQFAYTTGCWTSMASTTIPPRANPRPPWPNGLIARSRNSPTST